MVKGERARVAPDPKDMAPVGPEAGAAPDRADVRLQQLGYKPQMVRGFNAFTNFAISFSIMSLMTGVTGGFNLGMPADDGISSRVQPVRPDIPTHCWWYAGAEFGGPVIQVYGEPAARTLCVSGQSWDRLQWTGTRLHAQQLSHLQLEAGTVHCQTGTRTCQQAQDVCTAACEREPVLQAGSACACSP